MKTKNTETYLTLLAGVVLSPFTFLHAGIDSSSEALPLDEAIEYLEEGEDDVLVAVEGVPLSLIDDDEYRFAIGELEVLMDTDDLDVTLPFNEILHVVGELDYTDDDDDGYLYELDAITISTVDGTLIATLDDEEDVWEERYPLDEAIERLDQGWEDAYVTVEGTPIAMVDDDEYRFATSDGEVILEVWDDDITLVLNQTIRVTGELELADADDVSEGYWYELDAMYIEDLDGNPIGGEAQDPTSDGAYEVDDFYGPLVEGTLAELVALLTSSMDEDMYVRTVGILGEKVSSEDDDEDYFFTDGSGVTVVLDLDSRAEVDFAFAPGIELEIIGELEKPYDDGVAYEDTLFTLDAVEVGLPGIVSLDIGQQTAIAGATVSDWIGYYWDFDDSDWFYHPTKGFMFSKKGFEEDGWFFSDERRDWFYVNSSYYPIVWSNSYGWHYLSGSAYGEAQDGFSFANRYWILNFWSSGD